VFADGRNSASVAGGAAWPEGMDGTWYVTAAFRWHLDDNWAIEPDIGYWNQDEAQELCLARGCVVYGLSDLQVGANFLYVGTASKIGLYTGGGLAGHWRDRTVTRDVSPPENAPDIDDARLGLQIIFGADIPIANAIDITLAIRNDWIFREDDLDTQAVAKVYGGLRFYFD